MSLRSFVSLLAAGAAFVQPPLAFGAAPTPADAATVPSRPAAARPNVLIWLMDDVGFAQVGCFGGLVETPNVYRLAAMGLRYSNYHTPPVHSGT